MIFGGKTSFFAGISDQYTDIVSYRAFVFGINGDSTSLAKTIRPVIYLIISNYSGKFGRVLPAQCQIFLHADAHPCTIWLHVFRPLEIMHV